MQTILSKKEIRQLSSKLANIHITSKNFAKDKLSLFAGQKNFSGRSLKYIYNTIKVRINNLNESIKSVIQDCYCNSYKTPEELEEILITAFNEEPANYNEIMNYLRRDEEDAKERYESLYPIIDNFIENDMKFDFCVFYI